jgi:hypothetical protein
VTGMSDYQLPKKRLASWNLILSVGCFCIFSDKPQITSVANPEQHMVITLLYCPMRDSNVSFLVYFPILKKKKIKTDYEVTLLCTPLASATSECVNQSL